MNTNVVRLGVDVGGTFTDAALEAGEKRYTLKVLTTPLKPEIGVIQAIDEILAQAELGPGDVDSFTHGTTLATNALIERRGAKLAFVTTEGFRDSLEIRSEDRYEQYDVFIDLPEPLVPRALRFTVPERLNVRGEVLKALDETAVRELIPQIRACGAEAVAIGFLHSYLNPDHERRVRDILMADLPDICFSLSSEVSPEMREYERFSTTCVNAYVQPIIAGYLDRLSKELDHRKFRCPMMLMLSGGGLSTVETSRAFPVRMVESGPAGGAIYATHVARQLEAPSVISFDMGGTTAKVCLIDDYQPQMSRRFEAARIYRFKKGSGIPLKIPVIEMVEIGAGGGSIATIDQLGNIAVGPESAGSEPGPVCYGRGGEQPTVTDADLVLGRIDPDDFAGGRLKLDTSAARGAHEREIGSHIGGTAEAAAYGVSEMVDENMANAARVHAIESGKELSARTMIAFGGAAPLHAARIAEKLGVDRFVVPTGAGVGSAVGFLRAPVAFEVTQSDYQLLSDLDLTHVNDLLEGLGTSARNVVLPAALDQPLVERRSAFVRYKGQGHELSIDIPSRILTQDDKAELRIQFEDQYRRNYRWTVPAADIELLSWSVTVSTEINETLGGESGEKADEYRPEPTGSRRVFDIPSERFVDCPVYYRDELSPGARVIGPAVVVEIETTTIVSSLFDLSVNSNRFLICQRKPS